jgi:hypothetical protein
MSIVKMVLCVGVLLTGCAKGTTTDPGDAGSPGPGAGSAISSAAPAASATSAGSASVAVGAHLASLEVCNLVVKAKVGKACQQMPTPGGGADASQFTMAETPARKGELYGGSFTYGDAASFEAALAAFKAEKVGKNRATPVVLSNSKAFTIVVADGEVRAADVEALTRIVAELR